MEKKAIDRSTRSLANRQLEWVEEIEASQLNGWQFSG